MVTAERRGRRLALVIGVSEYQHFDGLKTPLNDAEAVAAVLEDPAVGGYEVELVPDESHTVIREKIEDLCSQRHPADTVVLYFSGHGERDARKPNELYLAARDTKPNRPGSTAISKSFVEGQLEGCDAGRIVVLLDCCHAGVFTKGPARLPDFVAGTVVIAACQPNQKITAAVRDEHGVLLSPFTAAAVHGLRSGAADLNGDGTVTALELFRYVERELTRQAIRRGGGGDWPKPEIKITRNSEVPLARNPHAPARTEPPPPPHGARGASLSRRGFLVATGGLAAGGAVAVGGIAIWRRSAPPPARLELTLVSSPEKRGVLGRLADQFNRTGARVDGRPLHITVSGASSSGYTLDSLVDGWSSSLGAAPDVWSPASSIWLGELRLRVESRRPPVRLPAGLALPASKPQAITASPLVIAVPQQFGDELGWPSTRLDWRDLVRLAVQGGWAAVRHPELGPFRLAKTQPVLSTSGLEVTLATYLAGSGRRPSDLQVADLERADVKRTVRQVEHSVVHYASTTLTFLDGVMQEQQRSGGKVPDYLSAVAVEEQTVWAYNHGDPEGNPDRLDRHPARPAVPLLAITPPGGTFVSDHPYIVLTADPSRRRAADAFLRFLHEPETQRILQRYGFRHWSSLELGGEVTAGDGIFPGQRVVPLQSPAAPVVHRVMTDWPGVRKSARILLVLDVSASMRGDKLEKAKQGAIEPLGLFDDKDEVGLWEFSSGLGSGGRRDYRELVPPRPVTGGQARALRDRLRALSIDGGQGRTALYSTIQAAVATLRRNYDANRINEVVIITDGTDDSDHPPTLPLLLDDLGSSAARARPVRVFTVGYAISGSAEQIREARSTLRTIARSSNGVFLDAPSPAEIASTLLKAIATA